MASGGQALGAHHWTWNLEGGRCVDILGAFQILPSSPSELGLKITWEGRREEGWYSFVSNEHQLWKQITLGLNIGSDHTQLCVLGRVTVPQFHHPKVVALYTKP